jgi:hypothetical protein
VAHVRLSEGVVRVELARWERIFAAAAELGYDELLVSTPDAARIARALPVSR